jgi:hypothetical protein
MSRYSWHPATSAQKAALDSSAQLLLFGGSAGSLKTETLLMDAAQEVTNKNLNAIIFRASFTQVTDLVRKTRRLYVPLGGKYNGSTHTWTFPSGAVIRFAYMSCDDDVWQYLGPEYSFIGVDESTLHTEFQVRNIIGRLRSTDPTLRLRVRLTSNPGNIGAVWHIPLFLRGFCPVHFPDRSAQPGKLYYDCVWPSDGKEIPMSVCFIPGRLTDHSLLGPDYMQNLLMMSGANAEAMATGCWDALEGAYFPFLRADMLKPLALVDVEWWHNHFIGIDYGYGRSYAAAGLYVRSPAEVKKKVSIPGVNPKLLENGLPVFEGGRIRKIGEICEPMMPVHEFAKKVVEAFVAPDENGQRRVIVAVFADPANFNPSYDIRLGTSGHSVSDQMDEVFAPWDLTCRPASNQRVAGWQLLYRLLTSGEFEICHTCPNTLEALRTRMCDPDKPGDIIKVPGDPNDDRCDETRYSVFSFIHPADKPRELRLQEALQGIDLSTRQGMSSAAIRYQQASEELDRAEAPQPMFGRTSFRRR